MVTICREKNRLRVTFPYSPELVSMIKTIPGHCWHPKEKYWTIFDTEKTIQQFFTVFYREKINIESALLPAARMYLPHLPAPGEEELLRQVAEEIRLKGYSPKTSKAYLCHIKRYIRYFRHKNVTDLTSKEIREYLLNLINNKQCSEPYFDQVISAIKFLYNYVFKKTDLVVDINRPKKNKKLPEVLSEEEINRIFNSINNETHRLIMLIIYSSGLRISEVVRLKLDNFDFDRKLIHIKRGKGKKDRYTILSQVVINHLEKYIRLMKPDEWLFPGAKSGAHLTERSVQKVMDKAVAKAKIRKNVTVHTLRHSFATHLLESGTDLRYIQELLGHASSKTTEIYTHVSRRKLGNIQSPLDRMMLDSSDKRNEFVNNYNST